MQANLPPDSPCPRLCHLIKWPDFNGYGFNLHAEKSKQGQYIGKVDEDSPALLAGLREGDKIIEVNNVNICNENHRQVVERIKSITNETRLLVIDDYGDRWYRERKIVIKSSHPNVIYYRTPVPRPQPGTLPIPMASEQYSSTNQRSTNKTNSNNNGSIKSSNSPSSLSSSPSPSSSSSSPSYSKSEAKAKTINAIGANDVAGHIETVEHIIADSGDNVDQNINSIVKATEDIHIESERSSNGVINTTKPIPNIGCDGDNRTESPISLRSSSSISTQSNSLSNPIISRNPEQIHDNGKNSMTRPSSSSSSSSSSFSAGNGAGSGTPSEFLRNDNGCELNLNMTAAEMRKLIAQRKKKDVKNVDIDLRKKYEIIQQM
ncbi:histone acetyltransferase KAT2B [Sarcoptes scabiei]|nr:histone acetyltransferase KAT2B [Sarcoptes scabiei]